MTPLRLTVASTVVGTGTSLALLALSVLLPAMGCPVGAP